MAPKTSPLKVDKADKKKSGQPTVSQRGKKAGQVSHRGAKRSNSLAEAPGPSTAKSPVATVPEESEAAPVASDLFDKLTPASASSPYSVTEAVLGEEASEVAELKALLGERTELASREAARAAAAEERVQALEVELAALRAEIQQAQVKGFVSEVLTNVATSLTDESTTAPVPAPAPTPAAPAPASVAPAGLIEIPAGGLSSLSVPDRMEAVSQRDAATVIGKVARGQLARSNTRSLMPVLPEGEREAGGGMATPRKDKAAVKLQSVQRGKVQRRASRAMITSNKPPATTEEVTTSVGLKVDESGAVAVKLATSSPASLRPKSSAAAAVADPMTDPGLGPYKVSIEMDDAGVVGDLKVRVLQIDDEEAAAVEVA